MISYGQFGYLSIPLKLDLSSSPSVESKTFSIRRRFDKDVALFVGAFKSQIWLFKFTNLVTQFLRLPFSRLPGS